ncbi:MAG TPA: hypothetical protein VNU95_10145, partial [Candidatus Acidoferrales bacterium]|nr:hypothetical protein [Candidatus Acidoferrales bacterium]
LATPKWQIQSIAPIFPFHTSGVMEGGTDTLTCTPSPRPFQQGKPKSTRAGRDTKQIPTDTGQKMKSPLDLSCEGTAFRTFNPRVLRAWDTPPSCETPRLQSLPRTRGSTCNLQPYLPANLTGQMQTKWTGKLNKKFMQTSLTLICRPRNRRDAYPAPVSQFIHDTHGLFS